MDVNYDEILIALQKALKKCPVCKSETAIYLYGKSGCNECIGEPWEPEEKYKKG